MHARKHLTRRKTPPVAEAGRSRRRPLPPFGPKGGGGPRREPKGYDGDVRRLEVGWTHSTREAPEQRRWCATGRGGGGGKGSSRGESCRSAAAPDTVPD